MCSDFRKCLFVIIGFIVWDEDGFILILKMLKIDRNIVGYFFLFFIELVFVDS